MTTETSSPPGGALDPENARISTASLPGETLPAADDTLEAESQPAKPAQKQAGGGKAVREIVETLLLAVIIFVAVRALVLNFRVDGSSMTNSLESGEMLLVNRNIYARLDTNKWLSYLPFVDKDGENVVYLFHPPERGDVIVFNPPVSSEKPYIKRVVGIEGDTVQVKGGYVYLNGIKLDEEYTREPGKIEECGRLCNPVTVQEGEVIVFGDNRNNSQDSRSFGAVPIDNIIGKAWLTYWPFDMFGLVPHQNYPEPGDPTGN